MRTYANTGVSVWAVLQCTSRVGNAVMMIVTTTALGILATPSAAADPAPRLKDAVVSARGSTQCPPLRYDPLVERAAEIVNRSTSDYLSHSTSNSPADGTTDALPILKDLGSSATKAWSLFGLGHNNNDGDAIKGAVLEGSTPGVGKSIRRETDVFWRLEDLGSAAFANCSYTDFGVSLIHNVETGFSLVAVVLAGT